SSSLQKTCQSSNDREPTSQKLCVEVLVISGVPEAAVANFEWRHPDQSRSFREFLVPADVLNRFPIVGIYPDTWSWISGNFEYVGPLVDMGPLLSRTDETQAQ